MLTARKVISNLKPALIGLLLLLFAAQCQADGRPVTQLAALPTTSPPTPGLIPAIKPGDGSDLIDRLLERGVIRVGIRIWPGAEFSPPAFRGYSNAVTGGALNGFEVDIARLLADGLGLELELVEAYPPVIASGDWRGEWDIAIASLVPFDQSPETIAFSRPYAYMPMGILIPAEENKIQTLADLAGKKVGVLEYSAYQSLLTGQGQSLSVDGQILMPQIPDKVQTIGLSNLLKAIHQLAEPDNGEEFQVKAIFGPTPILQEAVESGLPLKLAPQAKSVGFQPLAIAVVPQDGLKVDRLLSAINQILELLQRQGTLAEIYYRWYQQDLSQIGTR